MYSGTVSYLDVCTSDAHTINLSVHALKYVDLIWLWTEILIVC